jgi:hypothetical protein
MSDAPRLDEMTGDVGDDDRAMLKPVHDLLVTAGPPAELPPHLAVPPAPPRDRMTFVPRRYRAAALGVSVVAAAALVLVGYVAGRGARPAEVYAVTMAGSGGATAEITVLEGDAAGNWPMRLTVSGLAPLPPGEKYELWLTRQGKPVRQCGVFAVSSGETEVTLNAPYRLRSFTGWIVVTRGSTRPVLRTTAI